MFKKRLIVTLVSIFVLGVVFGINSQNTFSFRALFTVLAALSLVIVTVYARNNGNIFAKRIFAAALAVAAFSFGVLRVSLYNTAISSDEVYNQKSDTVTLKIIIVNSDSLDASVVSSECGVDENSVIRFFPESIPEGLFTGDYCSAEITYRSNVSSSYYANNVTLSASGRIIDSWGGKGLLYRVRKNLSQYDDEIYKGFTFAPAISKAITLGDCSELDSYIYSLYKTMGTSHILAISGLHISLICFGVYSFLGALGCGLKIRSVISALLAVLYTVLVGFLAGAVRSAIMLVVFMLSRVILRRPDGITTLFVSLTALLLVNPYSILSVGLQLSFLCTLGIILSEPILTKIQFWFFEKANKQGFIKRKLWLLLSSLITSFLVSVAAALFSFPASFLAFDTFSYLTAIASVIEIPVFNLAIALSMLAYLVAPFSLTAASVAAYPAGVIYDSATKLSEWFFAEDIGVLTVHAPLMRVAFILSLSMIAVLVFLNRRKAFAFSITAATFALTLCLSGIFNEATLKNKVVIDYSDSYNSYLYVQSGEKNTYVDIDGYTVPTEIIFKNGVTRLENYIVTDYSAYAINRFDKISGSLPIKNLFLPLPQNASDVIICSKIKQLANERNCVIIEYGNSYCGKLDDSVSVEIFGKDNNISEEMLLCVNVDECKIRILGNGFSNAVNCDIALVTKGFTGNYDNIIADRIFYKESLISESQSNLSLFSERLVIKTDKTESEFEIYEP